jgi:BirA family transcriptional regulator, biotin operon repressor / biotin---[acetyl-CoA-carboxylase] ligase
LTPHSPPAFDPSLFEARRLGQGTRYGHAFNYTRETGSTNDDALAAARAGAASGSVFLTDHQTQGRGRRGKTWLAAPRHNLLFSVLVRPAAATPVGSALTLVVGLAVRDALAPHSRLPLAVKWPNDVLADGRKLAGILCEGQFEGPRLIAIVIGIGINVFDADFPEELASQVACLEGLGSGSASLERELLLAAVLGALEARLAVFESSGFSPLLADFSRHDALAGMRVEVSGSATLVGTARGVDAEGRLLVESDGLLVPVVSGTVRAQLG